MMRFILNDACSSVALSDKKQFTKSLVLTRATIHAAKLERVWPTAISIKEKCEAKPSNIE